MKSLAVWIKHIYKDFSRSITRTLLIVSFASLMLFAVAYLQYAIRRSAEEVDNLFYNAVVSGEIVHNDEREVNTRQPGMGVFVNQRTVDSFVNSGFLRSIYLEAGEPRNRLLPSDAGYDIVASELMRMINNDMILGINDLDGFISRNTVGASAFGEALNRLASDQDIAITFAEGFSKEDFIFTGDSPLPVIVHDRILESRGVSIGETALLASQGAFTHYVVIIGSYTVGFGMCATRFGGDPLIIMHLDGLKHISRNDVVYVAVEFTISHKYNRDIPMVRDVLTWYTSRISAGRAPLILLINDDEIRQVLGSMEQTLSLLTLLYPLALVIIALLSLGLPILMQMQKSKVAAIYRSLGVTKLTIRLVYAGGYTLLYMWGVVLGVVFTRLILSNVDASLFVHFALALTSTVVGAVIGAVIISKRPPLELLQVKE